MRIASDEKQLRQGFGIAQAEAGAAFDNNAVYLEKYIVKPAPHRDPAVRGRAGQRHPSR
jgi:acetyl/propionyl-CoA carboxylase alpha subunit